MLNMKRLAFCASLVLMGLSSNSMAQFGGGRWADRDGQLIGSTRISNGRDFDVIRTSGYHIDAIQVCAKGDDLMIESLTVRFANSQRQTLHVGQRIRQNSCSQWKDLSGVNRDVVEVFLVGRSPEGRGWRRDRDTRVEIYGKDTRDRRDGRGGRDDRDGRGGWGGRDDDRRPNPPMPPPRPSRTWMVHNPSTSCGDSSGPFYGNSSIPQCPYTSADGGPIGISCEGLASGSLCYGASYWKSNFFCSAPNGKVPPWGGAQIYNMYVCP